MDIQKWLDEIVQPGSSSKLTNGGLRKSLPHSIPPVKPDDGRHRRKLSIADSSLLDPLSQQEEKPPRRQKSHRKKRAVESIKSYTSQDTRRESTESLASSHRYLRKPRHKTRPERYDPSAKVTRQREAHSGPKRKREAKVPRRKSKRKKHDSGIMQSFQAENVSGERLTVSDTRQVIACRILTVSTVETARTAGHIQQGQDFDCNQRSRLYVALFFQSNIVYSGLICL